MENDLEAFQQRAALAEKENDALREQIRILENNLGHVDPGRLEDLVCTNHFEMLLKQKLTWTDRWLSR